MGRLTKYCYYCKDRKSVASFARDKSRADGFNSVCRLCARKKDRVLVEKSTGVAVRINNKRDYKHEVVAVGYKECGHCHAVKPRLEFWSNKRAKDGKYPLCKVCAKIERRANCFGITVADVEAMHADQGGVCAICGCPETAVDKRSETKRTLSIDHCHETGGVRGLLCGKCNTGLGMFRDNIDLMASAISYLINSGYKGEKKSAG